MGKHVESFSNKGGNQTQRLQLILEALWLKPYSIADIQRLVIVLAQEKLLADMSLSIKMEICYTWLRRGETVC